MTHEIPPGLVEDPATFFITRPEGIIYQGRLMCSLRGAIYSPSLKSIDTELMQKPTGWAGAVVEDVALVRAAIGAADFQADHAVAGVAVGG